MNIWKVRYAAGFAYPWEIVGTYLIFRTEEGARAYARALNTQKPGIDLPVYDKEA